MVENQKEVIVERKSSTGWIVAIVVVVLLIIAAIYGIPYLTGGNNSTTNVDVNPTPAPTTSTGQ